MLKSWSVESKRSFKRHRLMMSEVTRKKVNSINIFSIKVCAVRPRFIQIYAFFRSFRPEVFYKKVVFKTLTEFIRKHLCQSLYFNKVTGLRLVTLLKKETLAQGFACKFCEIYKNTFLHKTPRWLLLYFQLSFSVA